MFQRIVELMYFVPDRHEATAWYAKLFDAPITYLDHPDHFFVLVGDQEIWFSEADHKVSAGTAGQVAYWRVDCFDTALEKAMQMGAVLYRGPLDRGDGSWMCQVKDPFGNLLGFFGTRRSE